MNDNDKCPQCGWSAKDVNDLTAEIERLSAQCTAYAVTYDRLRAAVEALRRSAIEEAQDVRERWIPKHDKLRAALERIAKARDVSWDFAAAVAREALGDKPVWAVKDVNELTAEIERLTAERDEARRDCAAVMRSADSMATGAVIAERDRLRAALEWYEKAEPIELHTNAEIAEHQRRAREALAGAKDIPDPYEGMHEELES